MIESIVVHTPIIENFIEVVKYAFANGIYWNNNHSALVKDYMWNTYREYTCIAIDGYKNTLYYSPYKFYLDNGFEIMSIEGFHSKRRCEKALKELR